MKLIITVLFSLITCLPTSKVSGQVVGDAQPLVFKQSLESKSLIVLYTSSASLEKVNALKPKPNATGEETNLNAEKYDESVLAEFGSYMNPYNNYLKVIAPNEVEYTKVQLMDISSGKTILKMDLSEGENSIDLSETAPGTYILILTDEGRNIHSEEFSIY